MYCCDELIKAMDLEMIVKKEPHQIRDGRLRNELNTEYFLKSGQDGGPCSDGYVGDGGDTSAAHQARA